MADSLRRPGKKSFAKNTVILIAFATTGFLSIVSLALHTGFLAGVSLPCSFHLLWVAVNLIILAIWWRTDAAPRDESKPDELALFISPAGLSSPSTPADEAWYDVLVSPAVEPGGGEPAVPIGTEEKAPDEWESAEAEEERESLDDTWRAIMDERAPAAAPVLRKSDTWERMHRDEVALEAAAAAAEGGRDQGRRMTKSATFKEGRAAGRRREEVGWRRREVLDVGKDELFRRVETFIKKHHDHLRLQRQESEHRRYLERLHR